MQNQINLRLYAQYVNAMLKASLKDLGIDNMQSRRQLIFLVSLRRQFMPSSLHLYRSIMALLSNLGI